MKKTILLVAIFSFGIFPNSKAQGFEQGKTFVSLGTGGPYFPGLVADAFLVGSNNISHTVLYPLYLKGEMALSENMGIGLSLAYAGVDAEGSHQNSTSSSISVNYIDKASYKTASALLRFNYHFVKNNKLDPYMGLGFGYRWGHWNLSSTDPSYTFSNTKTYFPFGADLTVGCRFMFSDMIGAYAEIGVAKSPFQFGINFRF
jgi:outer membrane protein W